MQRLAIVFVAGAMACGPSSGDATASAQGEDGSESSAGDATASGTTAADATTSTSTSGEPPVDTSSDAEATTESTPDELPPAAEGNWLCTGFEDPLYLRISMDDAMGWIGTACGPNAAMLEPSEWTNCDDLLPHVNILGTQIYWAFVLAYGDFGGPEIVFELGLSYVDAEDTLEGFIHAGMADFTPETCTREP